MSRRHHPIQDTTWYQKQIVAEQKITIDLLLDILEVLEDVSGLLHQKNAVPWLVVNGKVHRLLPNQEIKMTTTVGFGQTITYKILWMDTATPPMPMATAPSPDSIPSWSTSTPATGALVASADGLSAVYTPTDPGQTTPSDVVSLTLTVAGVSFSVTDAVSVQADPVPVQTLGSIGLSATVA
jgi:hypothetical protein